MTLPRRWCFGLIVLARCAEPLVSVSPDAAVPTMTLRCTGDREAAVPDGRGGHLCIAVGARGYGGDAIWPTVAAAETRYVRDGAPVGGDGTREHPFSTIALALAGAPTSVTVALSAGQHRLDATVTIARDTQIVGAGPDRTTIQLPAHEAGIVWQGASGAMRGVFLLRPGVADGSDATPGLDVRGGRVEVQDVVVEGAGVGIQVADATLIGERIDVRASGRNGVRLMRGAAGVLRSFVVQRGAAVGVSADEAHLHLADGLIDHNGGHGLALVNAAAVRGGSASCDGVVDVSGEGPRDCIRRVSVQCNGIAGVYVDGPRVVDMREVAVWGTRQITGTPGGDGLYAQRGTTVLFDTDGPAAAIPGLRSIIGGNARMGVLVDGVGTSVSARGLLVQANTSGGLFVQESAAAREVVAARFVSNGAVGIGVARGATLQLLESTRVEDTRLGAIAAVGAAGAVTLRLADGLSVADGEVTARNNILAGNARFGAVFFMARGEFSATSGANNRYAWRAWSSSLSERDNSVMGLETPPEAMPPVATGAAR